MDKYEKIRVVGRGSSGTVHLGRNRATGRAVILKEIPVLQMSKEEKEMSLTEAKVLSMLDHPNIIAYYDNFLEAESIVIVMEYAPGGTLHDYIKQRGSALLQEEEVLNYLAQILLALEHVHSKQILHRDLKSQNLLLNKRKNVVKVGDFGISKILSSKSKACSMVGTPSNLSPEICMGRPYDHKSDIWALGCVLYELLTLKSPFTAETLPGLVQKITNGRIEPIAEHYSAGLRQLASSLLHRDPSRRPNVRQLVGHPVVIPVLCSLYLNLGALPCVSKSNRSSGGSLDRTLSRSAISSGDSVTSVLLWEEGSSAATSLEVPVAESHVMQVAAARDRVVGVATCTRVVSWKKESPEGCTNPVYRGCLLKDKVASRIARVACGDDFTILLSEAGTLISFGSGASGCLGHGNRQDVEHPRIIERLLHYEIIAVACGPSHVVAITGDHHAFAWGSAENGRLGLELPKSADSPQMCGRPKDARPTACFCGPDCSFLAGPGGELWACGSNRNRKLAVCEPSDSENVYVFTAVQGRVFLGAPVISIAGTADCTAVLTDMGALYVLGDRKSAVAGAKKRAPVEMVSISDRVAHVACSDSTVLAATEKGRLLRWKELDANGRPVEVLPVLETPPRSKVISLTCCRDTTVAVTVMKRKT